MNVQSDTRVSMRTGFDIILMVERRWFRRHAMRVSRAPVTVGTLMKVVIYYYFLLVLFLR